MTPEKVAGLRFGDLLYLKSYDGDEDNERVVYLRPAEATEPGPLPWDGHWLLWLSGNAYPAGKPVKWVVGMVEWEHVQVR